MNKNLYVSENNQKFINAFINVARILEPQVEFDDVIYQKHTKDDGVVIDIAVSGFTKNGTMVQVTKELRDPMKGEEVVVRHINPNTMKVIKERGVWFFSFNWKGLMNTWEVDSAIMNIF
jgi:hypothetical protein